MRQDRFLMHHMLNSFSSLLSALQSSAKSRITLLLFLVLSIRDFAAEAFSLFVVTVGP